MSILIVDDSSVVRSVVRQALEMANFKDISEAIDGLEALDVLSKNLSSYKLLVLDVNMPRMDGITLVGEIRKMGSNAPIIMLTTETDREKMKEAKNLGATGWIVKPFEADKFIKVVQMFVKAS